MKKLGLFDNLVLHISPNYKQEFRSAIRTDNVKRVYILSGIGLLFFILLLGLDYIRYINGLLVPGSLVFLLFFNHLAMAFFAIPVLVILNKRKQILTSQYRFERAIIYSTVTYSGICLLTMAVLSLIDRNSILIYGIYVIIINFIIIFPHIERVVFNLLSFLIIITAIILVDIRSGRSVVMMYINILECIGMGIPAFAISTHLFNDRIKQFTFDQLLRDKTRQIEENNKTLQELTEQLRELNEQRSRLYTNITHEFRTPLTVVLGMNSRLRTLIGSRNASQVSEAIDMIERNGKNLLRLINQILDLSKLESGTLSENLIQANIIAFLRYANASFQSYATSKDIHLVFLTDLEVLNMDFDLEKIQQIYSNLLSNAIKFTPEGGRISVSVKMVAQDDAEQLMIMVKDTGIGIDPEKLPFIFNRFYQVNDGTTRHHGGSGIGLALAKELVQFMGGFIEVSSSAGQGTTFTIYLPVRRQATLVAAEDLMATIEPFERPIAGQPAEHLPADGFPTDDLPILLIIEDNSDVVQYLKSCLNKDYQLEIAYDGQQGIDKALELLPDVIISDVMMPKKDGYEVCETLKTDERSSHIPIILLTAKATIDDKLTGLRHGADQYLAKPFQKEELMLHLQNLITLRLNLQNKYSKGSAFWEAGSSSTSTSSREDAFLVKMNQLIEQNLVDEDFGINQLCKALAMSRSQIHRKVKALTGFSTAIYLRTLRLYKAKSLLRNTEMNISEIAYAVGFKDPNYFTHVYVEAFGETPSATRK